MLDKALSKLARALGSLRVSVSLTSESMSRSIMSEQIRAYSAQSPRRRQIRSNRKSTKNDNLNQFKIYSASDKSGSSSAFFNMGKQREKNFIMRGRSEDFADELNNEDPQKMLDDQIENDGDLNLYARDKNAYHDMIIEEDKQQRRRAKMAIVRNKMEKLEGQKIQHPNLLTWDAKEQIKYLNLNYPDTWTPEKICESYPITLEGCKKLLKSKWAPKTLEQIADHDQRVMENWKQLCKEEKTTDRGPALNLYKEYIKSNRENLMKYAFGKGESIEHDGKKVPLLIDSYSLHESVLTKPGKFSNMVKRDDKIEKLFRKKTPAN